MGESINQIGLYHSLAWAWLAGWLDTGDLLSLLSLASRVVLEDFSEDWRPWLIIGKNIKFICSFLYLAEASLALFVIGEATTDTKCIHFLRCQCYDDGLDPAIILDK